MLRSRHSPVLALVLLATVTTSGCADEPIAYSENVGLQLSAIKAKDVENGSVSEDKNVNTESGNPYGVFLKNAQENLNGSQPSYVSVTKAKIGLHSDSEGISRLDQAFKRIELFVSTSKITVTIGSTTSLSGPEANIDMNDDVDWKSLASVMTSGEFKLGLRCETGTTTLKNWEARLFMDLNFSAYE